jgi:hypothetical protein
VAPVGGANGIQDTQLFRERKRENERGSKRERGRKKERNDEKESKKKKGRERETNSDFERWREREGGALLTRVCRCWGAHAHARGSVRRLVGTKSAEGDAE